MLWTEFDKSYPYEMTERNHFCYQFFAQNNSMIITMGAASAKIQSGLEEAKIAAKKIRQKFNQPLVLWLSGGVDSEAMAQAFLAADVPFLVAIARYGDGLNDYDIEWAIDFCRKVGLKYHQINIDIDDFFESGRHADLAARYRCRSPQFTVHFEMMLRGHGVSLMPWQPPGVFRVRDGKIKLGFPEDHYLAYARFLATENKPGVPFFFLYTPELIASFLRTPTMQDILKNGKSSWSDYDLKLQVYNEAGFSLERRPDKWTGFEKIKEYFAKKYESDHTVFDRLYRKPLIQRYPFPEKVFYQIPKNYFIESEPGALNIANNK